MSFSNIYHIVKQGGIIHNHILIMDKNLIEIEHLKIPNEHLIEGENWLGYDIRRLLYKYGMFLNHVKSPKILEIGSWKGRSAIFMLNVVLEKADIGMTCLDTWEGSEEHNNADGLIDTFRRNLDNFGLTDRVNMIEDTSLNLLDHFKEPNSQVNFIYLDGSHTYWDVMSDLEKCFEILLSGGIMVGDDYLWKNYGGDSGVNSAVNDFVQFNPGVLMLETNYGFALRKL